MITEEDLKDTNKLHHLIRKGELLSVTTELLKEIRCDIPQTYLITLMDSIKLKSTILDIYAEFDNCILYKRSDYDFMEMYYQKESEFINKNKLSRIFHNISTKNSCVNIINQMEINSKFGKLRKSFQNVISFYFSGTPIFLIHFPYNVIEFPKVIKLYEKYNNTMTRYFSRPLEEEYIKKVVMNISELYKKDLL